MKNMPQRQSMGGGRPHDNAAIFEASDAIMEGQSIVMDLGSMLCKFTQMLAEVQDQLRLAQRTMLGTQARMRVA